MRANVFFRINWLIVVILITTFHYSIKLPFAVYSSSFVNIHPCLALVSNTVESLSKNCASHTLYQKSDLCVHRNETERPRSQFLHSCICV